MKKLLLTSAIVLLSFGAFSQNKIEDVPQTKKIVAIEYGVKCGKTGKSAVYVYSKLKTVSGFNPSTDRELVYTDSLQLLQRTAQYQYFMKSINKNKF